jgi:hypothetical protein
MLSESQKSEFWENGIVVVESALSAEDLKPLRQPHQWKNRGTTLVPLRHRQIGRRTPAGASFFNQQATS